MFKIVQQLVPNRFFVVVVAQHKVVAQNQVVAQHKVVAQNLVVAHHELEQHTTGTKLKFIITIFTFSSMSVFSNVCSLPVLGVEIGVVENQYYYSYQN